MIARALDLKSDIAVLGPNALSTRKQADMNEIIPPASLIVSHNDLLFFTRSKRAIGIRNSKYVINDGFRFVKEPSSPAFDAQQIIKNLRSN